MLHRIPVLGGLFGRPDVDESEAAKAHRLALIEGMTFEVIPLKSLTEAEAALPAGARVSVTASPAFLALVKALSSSSSVVRTVGMFRQTTETMGTPPFPPRGAPLFKQPVRIHPSVQEAPSTPRCDSNDQ